MSNETKKVKENAFALQLSRSNATIRKDRALRIATRVENSQKRLIMSLEEQIIEAQSSLDAMVDLSADNQSTTTNIISSNFSSDDFVAQMNQYKVDISLLKIKLEIAEATNKEWFE